MTREFKNSGYLGVAVLLLCVSAVTSAMGLRSLVALPVEKDGGVVRSVWEHQTEAEFIRAAAAYGFTPEQAMFMETSYRISPEGDDQQGELSVLYRHIVWQKDRFTGTDRAGLLGGAVVPTISEHEWAYQAGGVYTHFRERHEIDMDALYLVRHERFGNQLRYDLSWQYRLLPAEFPDWGIASEWRSVLELNGRREEHQGSSHLITLGLQWSHQTWVLEGGVSQQMNASRNPQYLVGFRFHF